MQIRPVNQYGVYYSDGSYEVVNAGTYAEAIDSISRPEEDGIDKICLLKKDVRTFIPELPDVISFTSVVSDGAEEPAGNMAYPQSGVVHVGDELSLSAVSADGYVFAMWERNGKMISIEPSFVYTMTPLAEGETECVFTAVFSKAEPEPDEE